MTESFRTVLRTVIVELQRKHSPFSLLVARHFYYAAESSCNMHTAARLAHCQR